MALLVWPMVLQALHLQFRLLPTLGYFIQRLSAARAPTGMHDWRLGYYRNHAQRSYGNGKCQFLDVFSLRMTG